MNNHNSNHETSSLKNMRDDRVLEFWKHFSGIGGIDKDRMVTITTWLLAFSATIIGYTLIHLCQPSTAPLALLGIFISIFACWIVLLYGSYAMWNWAMADMIVEDQEWDFLRPDRSFPLDKPKDLSGLKELEFSMIEKLGKPPFPRGRYAVIFRGFFLVSIFSALINLAILVYSLSIFIHL